MLKGRIAFGDEKGTVDLCQDREEACMEIIEGFGNDEYDSEAQSFCSHGCADNYDSPRRNGKSEKRSEKGSELLEVLSVF